jgi:hypothetical protein
VARVGGLDRGNWVPSMNAALIGLMMLSMTFGKVSELILNNR